MKAMEEFHERVALARELDAGRLAAAIAAAVAVAAAAVAAMMVVAWRRFGAPARQGEAGARVA